MYAIIEDGSHQFRVREGDRIRVDRRDGKPGDELVFPKVLLITEKTATPRSELPPWKEPEWWARSSTNSEPRRSSSRSSAGAKTFAGVTVIASPTRWSRSPVWSSPRCLP